MHRRLAELIAEPELRARHLALADTSGEPETVAALDTAAEIARDRGAPAAAAELVELAVGLAATTIRGEKSVVQTTISWQVTPGEPGGSSTRSSPPSQPAQPAPTHCVGWIWSSSPTTVSLKQRNYSRTHNRERHRHRVASAHPDQLGVCPPRRRPIRPCVRPCSRAVTDAERLGAATQPGPALGMRAKMDFMGGKGFDGRPCNAQSNCKGRARSSRCRSDLVYR